MATEFLRESGDRFQKTIVFCVDEEHAARMRKALVNQNADLVAENQRYVMRITGSDKEGQDQLGNFIDPESKNCQCPRSRAAARYKPTPTITVSSDQGPRRFHALNECGDSWYRSSRRPLRCRDRLTLDQIERLVVP